MNVNTADVAGNTKTKDTKTEDIRQDVLLDMTDNALKLLQTSAIKDEDYEKAAEIRDILASRNLKDNFNHNFDKQNITEELSKDALKEGEKDSKIMENISQEKDDRKEYQSSQIGDLKKKLDETKDDAQTFEQIAEELTNELNKTNEENSKMLQAIKDAKKAGDGPKVKKLQDVIKKLAKEKVALKDKYTGEFKKYNNSKINTLDTRRIRFKIIGNTNIDGNTEIGPKLIFKRHVRSRKNLNKTIKMFNKIKNDPTRAIKYIMTKTNFITGGKIATRFKKIKYGLTIRNTDKFDTIFNKQKKLFIDDLKRNLGTNISYEDQKTIKALEDRINYYLIAYKRKFITV